MGGAERAGTVVGSVELQRVIYLNTLAGASGGCHPPTVTLVTSEVIVPVQKPLKPDPLSKSPGPHSIETGDLATPYRRTCTRSPRTSSPRVETGKIDKTLH